MAKRLLSQEAAARTRVNGVED